MRVMIAEQVGDEGFEDEAEVDVEEAEEKVEVAFGEPL